MATIDPSKGVCRVRGRLPAPDGRSSTVLVNAIDETEAFLLGRREGLDSIDGATLYTPEEIAKWKALLYGGTSHYANSKPLTPEEIEWARQHWAARGTK